MPQAGQEPDYTDIENLVFAVAAQRDVNIVPKKGAERDVPSPPELGDRLCNIGVVEVDVVVETEHPSQADGHIRVGGKVVVELDGVEQRAKPRPRYRQTGKLPVHILGHQLACGVGDHHLFGQAHTEFGDALAEILHRDGAVFDLGGHVAVAHNGASHQLMVAGEIHQVFVVGFLRRDLAAVDVQHIADGLKGVKRDADRQGNLRHREI